MTATTTIETPEQKLDRIEQLCNENSKAMGLASDSSPTPSPRIHWLSLLLGAVLGAGVVALTIHLTGTLI